VTVGKLDDTFLKELNLNEKPINKLEKIKYLGFEGPANSSWSLLSRKIHRKPEGY
jgi:hypothetical protein